MSTHRVDVTFIGEVLEHPNADRLELAKVGETDWQVVVGKGQFKAGDPCIYIPIDSLLAEKLETYLFPPDSKITLDKHRVRSIKIRQAMSQGMVIEIGPELVRLFPKLRYTHSGLDVSEDLGITKYEPPASSFRGQGQKQGRRRRGNPDFIKYTDIENYKYYPKLFEPEDLVYITEKIHGTSVRYAMLPTSVDSLWRRVRKLFRRLPKYEFCYGSRNVQLQSGRGTVYYDQDVYAIIAQRLMVEDWLEPGEALYGEIVGSGIQKGYTYGCSEGDWDFYAYDVRVGEKYLDMPAFKRWCSRRGVKRVPQLYEGPMSGADLDELRSGESLVLGSDGGAAQPVREGIVIKPVVEERCYMGRKVLKHLNDEYLLDKENTDFH